jgi:hypothetical protein
VCRHWWLQVSPVSVVLLLAVWLVVLLVLRLAALRLQHLLVLVHLVPLAVRLL